MARHADTWQTLNISLDMCVRHVSDMTQLHDRIVHAAQVLALRVLSVRYESYDMGLVLPEQLTNAHVLDALGVGPVLNP